MNNYRCIPLVLAVLAGGAARGDWPMARHDPARSRVTDEKLPLPLNLHWVYRPAQPPRPAWPEPVVERQRIDFDCAPEPVIGDGRVLIGSNADDTVRALDAGTGRVQWQFTTGGPVRFAPALAGGKAYVASDDGHLYCLDAATGELSWQFRAAIRDDRLLGNGRMISRWPLRSGVLVAGGAAYVTAGMWPTEGVFVYALDAATGEVRWCNDSSGWRFLSLPHGGAEGFSDVSPQGDLLTDGNTLLVPTGRSVPAGYDLRTGRFLFFQPAQSKMGGGSWATIDGSSYVNMAWGASPPDARSMCRYALRTGAPTGNVRWEAGVFSAGGRSGYYRGKLSGSRGTRSWTLAHPERVYALALAGGTLLVGSDGFVAAREHETGKQLWRAEVPGAARTLAVAGGRLVVGTDTGAVCCFGPGDATARPAAALPEPPAAAEDVPDVQAVLSAARRTNATAGYALLIGLTETRLAEALARRTGLHVISVLPDPDEAGRQRRRLAASTRLYGSRIAVIAAGAEEPPPLPPYFANLVVVGPAALKRPAAELYRHLRPCGGVMAFAGVPAQAGRDWLDQGGIGADPIRQDGQGVVVVRPKLPGAMDWDAGRQADGLVRWPLELLWFGEPGPARMVDRHKPSMMPLAANGRLFVVGRNRLIAVDAYNGSELWDRRVSWQIDPDDPTGITMIALKDIAADDNSLYLLTAAGTVQLDAATGETTRYYGLKPPAKRISLEKPETFRIDVAPGRWGTVSIRRTETGLRIDLTSVDGKLIHPWKYNGHLKYWGWDHVRSDFWELFFDFRPPSERFGMYGRGTFNVVVAPPADAKQPDLGGACTGPAGADVKLTTRRTPTGFEATVDLAWDELARLLGARPETFGFGAALNACDDPGPYSKAEPIRKYLFADAGAHIVNSGWATVSVSADSAGDAGGSEAFDRATGGADDLPAAARAGRRPTHVWQHYGPIGKASHRHPLTGETTATDYLDRSYGCGGYVCSETARFFRSGALGIWDLADDSGLRNFGGVKPNCGVSMTAALGLLLVPEGSSGCRCSYSFQTSLALVPASTRRHEDWAIFPAVETAGAIRHAFLNFGAPGDRRDDGNLWLGCPRPATGSAALCFDLPMEIHGEPGAGPYRLNADRNAIAGTDRPWIYASGYRGPARFALKVNTLGSAVSLPADTAPTVDGKLDEPCWAGETSATMPGRAREKVYLRHDAASLYAGLTRPAKVDRRGQTAKWVAKTRGADAPVWQDDAWELYLSDDSGRGYVHLGISASGARYDARCRTEDGADESSAWNGAWSGAVSAGDSALTAEVAIPWKTIAQAGLDRDRLTVNVRTGNSRLSPPGADGWLRCRNFLPLGLGRARSMPPRPYTVRLHFAELEDVPPGRRVFDVILQGRRVLEAFDVVKAAGGPRRAVIREFTDIPAGDTLSFELAPAATDSKTLPPILSALEVIAQRP